MPSGTLYRPHEIQGVLKLYKKLREEGLSNADTYQSIADIYERTPQSVENLIKRMASTSTVAKQLLQANAFRLAARIVRKANVSEAIEVLRDPSIGAISPKQVEGGNQNRGFFLTVTTDSCGAVKASVGVVETPALPPAPTESEAIEAELVEDTPKRTWKMGGPAKDLAERLRKKRELLGQEV